MKSKAANRVPLYITAAVLFFSVSLHIFSRNLASRTPSAESSRKLDLAFAEQIEALTYDFRVKLGASLNEPQYVSQNLATLFFDDVSVEKVNDGSYSHFYAPAIDRASAKKLR